SVAEGPKAMNPEGRGARWRWAPRSRRRAPSEGGSALAGDACSPQILPPDHEIPVRVVGPLFANGMTRATGIVTGEHGQMFSNADNIVGSGATLVAMRVGSPLDRPGRPSWCHVRFAASWMAGNSAPRRLRRHSRRIAATSVVRPRR